MLRKFLRTIGGTDEMPAVSTPTYLAALLAQPLRDGDVSTTEFSDDPLRYIGERLVAIEARGTHGSLELEEDERAQFVTTYAGMLLENDALPPDLQLSQEDLEKPRALLLAFFGGEGNVQKEASRVLTFIEERFASARFGQARMLLRLFDTDEVTRRNNERNLFYEEMILRFMSERTSNIRDADACRATLAESLSSPGEALRKVAEVLSARAGVRLHLQVQPPPPNAWTKDLAKASAETQDIVEAFIPGWRWRPVATLPGSFSDHLGAHLGRRRVDDYVLDLVRSAYFVTLAPGATGFEDFMFRFVEWATANLDGVATRILPDVHRASTIDEVPLPDALEDIRHRFVAGSRFESGEFSREAIQEAAIAVHEELAQFDPSKLPEGDYDLGGLIADKLVDFPHVSMVEALRVHRLT